MSQISLKQLEAFVQVTRLESFGKAAQVLNTTQPNISARIASLEQLVGQQIMKRDAGSVRLTSIGERLYEKASMVLQSVDGFLNEAANPTLFQGVIRLGVTEAIAHSWLGKFLNVFGDTFPSLTLELVVDISSELTTALEDQSIDIALQNGPFEASPNLDVELGNYPFVWVAAPKLGISDSRLTKEHLEHFSILTHSRSTLPYQQLAHYFGAKKTKVRLTPSNSLLVCQQMTVQGLGIACLPEAIVREELEKGTLESLHYDWLPDPLSFKARFNEARSPQFLKDAARIAAEISFDFLNK